MKTKASSEMLSRRRVDTIKAVVNEYGLTLDIELVRSESNRADALTLVKQKSLGMPNVCEKPAVAVCGVPLHLCLTRGLPAFMRKPAIMALSVRCISRES